MPKIDLLPESLLVKTSDVDHAEWNYRPVLGILQRTRFKLIAALMEGMQVQTLLDIGYGSGVFYPQLGKHATELYGVDIHEFNDEVTVALGKHNIAATLIAGSVSSMPSFEDDLFDCAVAVSSMEYVPDIDVACKELVRVLRPNGKLILVTPGQSPILDFGLKLLGGEDAEDNYGDRRQKLLQALDAHFDTEKLKAWPPLRIPGLTVYRALRLTPKRSST